MQKAEGSKQNAEGGRLSAAADLLVSLWHRLTTTRYTRQLEAEVQVLAEEIERLRKENRGLLNSVLIRSGFPPIEDAAESARGGPLKYMRSRSSQQLARRLEMESRRPKLRQEKGRTEA